MAGAGRPRKEKEEIKAEEQNPDNAIELLIEESEPLPGKSPIDSIKDFASSLFTNEEEDKKTVARKKSTTSGRKSTFWKNKSAIIATGVIWAIATMIDTNTYEINGMSVCLKPKQEEVEPIVLPLMRIMDRHVPVGAVNPDVSDLGDALTATIALALEMRANAMLINYAKEYVEEKRKEQQNGQNGHFSRQDYPSL